MRNIRCFGGLLMAVLLFALGLGAQAPVGQIFGTVLDPSRAPIAAASVVVTNLATGQTFDIKTDVSGDYVVRELPPGEYSVTASSTGFKQVVRTPITLVAFEDSRVDVTLQLGPTSEKVVVTSDIPQVDTRLSTLGNAVDDRLLMEMPINNRNVIETINYTPGVEHVTPGNNVNRNQQRVNIAGNRSYSTNEQLDGASMYFAHRGQGIELPAPDAIEEVQVVTSGVSAQYGRGTAVFAAVTKSGGNQLHGTAWEFIRNDAFDSVPYFNVTKPFLRSHDFGATAGGPIIKKRLFFFAEYQGLRTHQTSQTSTPFPPTQLERAGNFNPCGAPPLSPCPKNPATGQPYAGNQIDPSTFDPVAVKILNMIPQPNLASGALSFAGPNPITGDGIVGKFDLVATQRDQLSFRWFWDYRRGVSPFPASPKQSIPNYSPAPNSQDPKTATVNYVRTWTPLLISTTRGSFTKWVYDEGDSVNTSLADLGATNFQDQYPTHRLPTITVNGRFSATAPTIDERVGVDYGVAQDWDWMRGAHEIKWGGMGERISFSHPNSSTSAGTFTFDGSITGNSVADFLLGTPVNFVQSSGSASSGHYYNPAFYGQDIWKATSRLTLTLGLRWEVYTAWREKRGQDAMFIPGVQSTTFPTAPLGMVFQSDQQYTYHTAWNNLGPRVGFAWDIFGNGRTSMRGGYGISYDPVVAEPLIGGQQPFSLSVTVNNPGPLSNPYQNTTNPFPYVVNPSAAKFKTPLQLQNDLVGPFRPMYNQNFSLTIERQLSGTLAAQVSYVGNLSRHGYNGYETNPAVYGPSCTPTTCTTKNTDARRIYAPLYGSMVGYSSNLNTSYNAVQAQLTKRFSHGLQFQGHYTFSKAIDQCSTEVIGSCIQQNPYDPAADRGLGDFDRTHVAVITYIYEIPRFSAVPRFLRQVVGGWQVASYHTFQSGIPFTVFTGKDASLTGVGNDRPNLIGDPNLPGDRSLSAKLAEWFNTAAFVANSPGQYGTAGRNILHGPFDWRWDMSAKKVFFPHGERFRLEFRGDVNDILNHTVFDAPGNSLASSKSFGVISSTVVSGRVVRLGLHLDF
ncbi:MAG TPA: carboxypeptidase regulatory-like domain-containing protein [Candidatus Bathyarchaeia archaeon]|nr:carboxypeptidase regulatory-like domain-containing protein [Candidatus Bathyarchaeia archaeon]